ncbi:MAG: GNAT family N-acetyltransferase [Clostridia bacterium]|nr:GNAT family N-acetyltransferase [Clostridia bacterium]
MKLSKFDEKYVRLRDIYGGTHTGIADHYDAGYCFHEFGEEEEAVIIEGFLIYASQIASIEEIEPHGCVELRTEQLILRRYRPEDVEDLHHYVGKDLEIARYTGWNPVVTAEMTRETVARFIEGYSDERFYAWVMDWEDVIVGTIGVYDCKDGGIEVGFSVVDGWRCRGFATAVLSKVLGYLTKNEGIPCVTARCAAENAAARRVLEKAGMREVRTEKGALVIGEKAYDTLVFEYTAR